VIEVIKVRILDRCEFCDGEAYIFVSEDVDAHGETFDWCRPCEACNGSENRVKLVNFREFADLLERANLFEPDYAALAQERPNLREALISEITMWKVFHIVASKDCIPQPSYKLTRSNNPCRQ